MPLSRHFYAIDEVQAALQYATTRTDRKETLFWCQEMILSGYVSEAISTLFEAWLWQKGAFCLSWLTSAWSTLSSEECSEQDILLAAYQLTSCERDHSLWSILVLTAMDHPPERVTPKTPFLLSDEREQYMVRALFQGKAYSAWWMARQLDVERVWVILKEYLESQSVDATYLEALKGYDKLLGYQTNEYDTIVQCLAVLTACLNPIQRSKSNKPLPLSIDCQSTLNEWASCIGTKKRRIYPIPVMCLYGMTKRGHLKWSQNTLRSLNDIESDLVGSPCWEEELDGYIKMADGRIQWKSDDAREDWYETFFPDDIPDEWTKADKEKSHGDGILAPTETVTLLKYARIHLSKKSRLAWNHHRMIHKFLEGKVWDHPSSIVSLFPSVSMNKGILVPLRRRLRVAV